LYFKAHDADDSKGECGFNVLPGENEKILPAILKYLERQSEDKDFDFVCKHIGHELANAYRDNFNNEGSFFKTLPEKMHTDLSNAIISGNSFKKNSEYKRLCNSSEYCIHYIKSLQTDKWIGCDAIIAYAIIKKLNIRIWRIPDKSQPQKIKVPSQYQHRSDPKKPTHDIMYVNGNHFMLLERLNDRTSSSQMLPRTPFPNNNVLSGK
jgi:hypothetical protein